MSFAGRQGNNAYRTSSDNTLDGEREQQNEKSDAGDNSGSGQEEEAQQGPPKPVGFFDSRLHKTRIDVAKKWILMSKRLPRYTW